MVARLAAGGDDLDAEIGDTDAMIEERFRRHRHAEIILSMPGFGVILGAEFLAATGRRHRRFRQRRPPGRRRRTGPGAARLRAHQRQPQPPPPLQPTAAARLLPGRPDRHPQRPRIPDLLRPQTRRGQTPTPKPSSPLPAAASTSSGPCSATAPPINPPHLPQRLDNFIEIPPRNAASDQPSCHRPFQPDIGPQDSKTGWTHSWEHATCHFSLALRARPCGGRGCAVVTGRQAQPFRHCDDAVGPRTKFSLTSVKILSCNSFGDSQSTSACFALLIIGAAWLRISYAEAPPNRFNRWHGLDLAATTIPPWSWGPPPAPVHRS